jgi:PAS domain S-box-containing protein
MVSPEGKYTYVNESFVRMLGYASAEEILGKTWDEVSDPRDLLSIRNEMNFALAERGKWFGALTVHSRNGLIP